MAENNEHLCSERISEQIEDIEFDMQGYIISLKYNIEEVHDIYDFLIHQEDIKYNLSELERSIIKYNAYKDLLRGTNDD